MKFDILSSLNFYLFIFYFLKLKEKYIYNSHSKNNRKINHLSPPIWDFSLVGALSPGQLVLPYYGHKFSTIFFLNLLMYQSEWVRIVIFKWIHQPPLLSQSTIHYKIGFVCLLIGQETCNLTGWHIIVFSTETLNVQIHYPPL